MDDLALAPVVPLDALGDRGRVRDPSIDTRRHLPVGLAQSREQLAHRHVKGGGHLLLQVLVAPIPEVARGRVAVGDLDGRVGEGYPLDEGARRHDRDVHVRGHAQAMRRARVERQQKAVRAATDREALQRARDDPPSGKLAGIDQSLDLACQLLADPGHLANLFGRE